MTAPDDPPPVAALLADQHDDLTALTAIMDELARLDHHADADQAAGLLEERLTLQTALRDREDEIASQLTREVTGRATDPALVTSTRSLVLARGLARGATLDPTDVVSEILDELRSVMLDHREDWPDPPGLLD